MGVAEAAIAALHQHDALAGVEQFGKLGAGVFVEHLGAGGHFQYGIIAVGAGAVGAHAVAALLRPEVLLVAVVDEGVEAVDAFDHDGAAAAAIAAVRPAIFDEFLAAKGNAAVAAG